MSPTHHISRSLLLASVFAWGLPALNSLAQDKVFPKQGVPATGKITKITPNEVVIEVRSKEQTYALLDVRKITFDGEPNGLDRARENMLAGQFNQALEELKKLAQADLKTPSVQQDYEFYRWYGEGKLGLAGSGDKNAAIRGLMGLASKNRNTHHLFPLAEMLGELSLAVGQPDKAANFFSMLANSTDSETKARGLYQLARVDLALNKVDEAKGRLQQLSSASSTSPGLIRLKTLAEVGLAECKLLEGDPQGALNTLNALVQKNDSSDLELFAAIKNAQGACYQSLDQPKQALLRYLQTDLLFFTAPEAHAEALYHLTQLWTVVGEPARAAEARSRLTSLYASSTWANKQ
jgi:tetratricopeptide (TPR) repeat protein